MCRMTYARRPMPCYVKWLRRHLPKGAGNKIKILVAFDDEYRSYRDVIASAIRILRPCTEVVTSDFDALEEELARFDPHLVICSCPRPANSGGVAAWIELSLGLAGPARICIGGHYWEVQNPNLETMLKSIDKVERLIQSEESFRKC
jgi:hypothetical protein